MPRTILRAFAFILFFAAAARAQQATAPAKDEKPVASREELEKQFAETLSGATLVGNFTITGVKTDQAPKEERYTLARERNSKRATTGRSRPASNMATTKSNCRLRWRSNGPATLR